MTQNKHYGIVSAWFEEKKAGYIEPVKGEEATLPPQNILLTLRNLAPNYSLPKIGDEVAFDVETGDHNLPYACNVELAASVLKTGQLVEVKVLEWDIQQNGGYGVMVEREDIHVFALGQFLKHFVVPEVGDIITGHLIKHENEQWMLEDICILPTPLLVDPRADKKKLVDAPLLNQKKEDVAGSAFANQTMGTSPESILANAATPQALVPTHQFQPVGAALIEDDLLREITQELSDPALDAEFDAAFGHNQEKEAKTISFNNNAPVTLRGRIVQWDDEKGYGHIQNSQDEKSTFFHISAYHYQRRRPEIGELVSFYCESSKSSGGKQKAIRVMRTEDELSLLLDEGHCDKRSMSLKTPKLLLYILVILIYLIVLAFFSIKLTIINVILSVITFFVYRHDKQVSIVNLNRTDSGYQGRIPEDRLQLLAVVGGWPGGLLARIHYKHKTTKLSFVRIFWVMVILHFIVVYTFLIHYPANQISAFLRN